jgi:molybdopterin converting factor small subunit
MIQFDAYGQTVNLRLSNADKLTRWDEITIAEAGQLIDMVKKQLPKNIQRIYELRVAESSVKKDLELEELTKTISDEQTIHVLPKFHGAVIKFLSDITDETLAQMNRIERLVIYEAFIEVPLIGLMSFPDFAPSNMKSFKFKGVTYWLPADGDGYGVTVPMYPDTTAIEFIESADIEMRAKQMERGRWDQAALMIAILCRPKVDGVREKYDEKKSRARAKTFEGLTMNVALDVFFCFIERLNTSATIGQIFIREAAERAAGGQNGTVGKVKPLH